MSPVIKAIPKNILNILKGSIYIAYLYMVRIARRVKFKVTVILPIKTKTLVIKTQVTYLKILNKFQGVKPMEDYEYQKGTIVYPDGTREQVLMDESHVYDTDFVFVGHLTANQEVKQYGKFVGLLKT